MSDKNSEIIRQSVIAEITAKRDVFKNILADLSGKLLQHAFIVTTDDDIPLKFDVNEGQVTNPQVTWVPEATRFTREDARNVAENVTDGNGYHAKAVHICTALREAIERIEATITMLTAAP
jgi:hypothetical protein